MRRALMRHLRRHRGRRSSSSGATGIRHALTTPPPPPSQHRHPRRRSRTGPRSRTSTQRPLQPPPLPPSLLPAPAPSPMSLASPQAPLQARRTRRPSAPVHVSGCPTPTIAPAALPTYGPGSHVAPGAASTSRLPRADGNQSPGGLPRPRGGGLCQSVTAGRLPQGLGVLASALAVLAARAGPLLQRRPGGCGAEASGCR